MTIDLPIAEPVFVALVFVRIAGLMLVAPVFAHRAVSVRVRATLGILLALIVAPGALTFAQLPESLGLAVLSELLVGVAIGFVSAIVLAPVTFMSEIVSVQGGLGAATALDPSAESPSVVIAGLMRFTLLVLFLAIGGHHVVIRALWSSFELVPVGHWLDPTNFASIAALGSVIFETGLRLAAPLTVFLLASNLVVGALGRAIPQLNLISLQLPAQIGLTLVVLAVGAGVFFDALAAETSNVLEQGLDAALGAH